MFKSYHSKKHRPCIKNVSLAVQIVNNWLSNSGYVLPEDTSNVKTMLM